MARNTQMGRQEVDETLDALTAAHQRIAAALYAMDTHPGHALLSAAPTAGRTASAWAGIRQRMGEVWADFTEFSTALDEARSARNRKSRPDLAKLTQLIAGPVVTTAGPAGNLPLPVAVRHLLDTCMGVTVAFDQILAAANSVANRLAPIAAAVAAAERLAAEVGDPPAVISGRRSELAEVSAVAVADPLGAADGEVDAALRRLAENVGAARDRLAAAVALKNGLAARRAASHRAIEELAAVEGEVYAAYTLALTKIADPGLPPLPTAAPGLKAEHDALEHPTGPQGSAGLLRHGALLDDLDRRIAAAKQRADLLRTAADGLVDRRAELRGRLDAYRVKGVRLGLGEHPGLAEKHKVAHDLLYTQPCDLPAATRAVHGYQQLLAALTSDPPAEERMSG